jgi:arsenate reductase
MTETKRYRILFVCIGNSCRSPMAEAIASTKYPELMDAFSAGLGPAPIVQALTFSCLEEAGVTLDPEKRPQKLDKSDWPSADYVINMSGYGVYSVIPQFKGEVLIWEIPDPIGKPMGAYRESRDLIDDHIARLAEALRNGTRLPGI